MYQLWNVNGNHLFHIPSNNNVENDKVAASNRENSYRETTSFSEIPLKISDCPLGLSGLLSTSRSTSQRFNDSRRIE